MTEARESPPPPAPPVARKIPRADAIHGDARPDDYFWLREKSNPEVIRHLEAENEYTRRVMGPFKPLEEAVYREILVRIKQTDASAPYRLGGWWYYTRTVEGKQYPIYYRKRAGLEAEEEVTLDLNELAAGHPFLGLGVYEVSDDGNRLAYSLDHTGFRQYRLHFKDLGSGAVLADSLFPVTSAVWAADGRTLFYVTEDAAKRPYRLYRHRLGEKSDDLLYEEKDALYRISTHRSNDKKMVFLISASCITSEAHFIPSADPQGAFKCLLPREVGHEYYPDHREGLFYLRTNKEAKNFRLVAAPAADPRPENWKELLPHRPEVKLEGLDLFKSHAVFSERERGLPRFRVLDFRTGRMRALEFPEPVYSANSENNHEHDTHAFRYQYQSFVIPSSIYEVDLETEERKLLKRTEILGGYDPALYQTERIWAKAADGTLVPISLAYRKGIRRDGSNPLLLYGYGSYGFSLPIAFSIPRLSLLERGVIHAAAHVRGGGDLGEPWHDGGKMMQKRNTFTDFIACAEHLISEKYTSREKLIIEGQSAGGLLMGAVLNLRPDLFKAVHLGVPFVDVMSTMLDPSLPLTIGEYLEWGNPNLKAEYEYMRSYCPYTNLEAKAYPPMLITASLNDSQVMYWEPAKYAAKLRAVRTDRNVLLLKTNMAAGHGGASGRYDAYQEQAFIYAFFLSQWGLGGTASKESRKHGE